MKRQRLLTIGAALALCFLGGGIWWCWWCWGRYTNTLALLDHGMNSEDARIPMDLQNLLTQLQMYETLNDVPPSTEQGLQALMTMPTNNPCPRQWRQLMPIVPIDSWGTPYQYRCPATKTKSAAYELFSAGKDRIPGTADDIGSWDL